MITRQNQLTTSRYIAPKWKEDAIAGYGLSISGNMSNYLRDMFQDEKESELRALMRSKKRRFAYTQLVDVADVCEMTPVEFVREAGQIDPLYFLDSTFNGILPERRENVKKMYLYLKGRKSVDTNLKELLNMFIYSHEWIKESLEIESAPHRLRLMSVSMVFYLSWSNKEGRIAADFKDFQFGSRLGGLPFDDSLYENFSNICIIATTNDTDAILNTCQKYHLSMRWAMCTPGEKSFYQFECLENEELFDCYTLLETDEQALICEGLCNKPIC